MTSPDKDTTATAAAEVTTDSYHGLQPGAPSPNHGIPDLTTPTPGDNPNTSSHEPCSAASTSPPQPPARPPAGGFTYVLTKDFWIVVTLGQVLALCLVGTNTLTTLLFREGTSMPAFQTFFNYLLLNLVYTSVTLYRYGWKGWVGVVRKDGWKYIILSFFDVEGNYFTVLAYRYTTILHAQLINFWAIVVVVLLSSLLLRVRYAWYQICGILICVGGMGLLLGSDRLTGAAGDSAGISSANQLKGDLFALAGATFYGLSNVAEEFLVSQRPLYEVVGQLGWWAMIINGVQAGIFDRASFRSAVWNAKVGGYLTGYTLMLSLFYSLVPILYRLASAAFFNISLLTSNFWGVIIGVRVFGYRVHFLYPIAFVLIMFGQLIYFLGKGVLGEAKKVWLGENQEKGVVGIGTAKRKIQKGNTGAEHGLEHASAGIV